MGRRRWEEGSREERKRGKLKEETNNNNKQKTIGMGQEELKYSRLTGGPKDEGDLSIG